MSLHILYTGTCTNPLFYVEPIVEGSALLIPCKINHSKKCFFKTILNSSQELINRDQKAKPKTTNTNHDIFYINMLGSFEIKKLTNYIVVENNHNSFK